MTRKGSIEGIKYVNMDTRQTAVFILILFHLTNVISGASLGNVKMFNESLDDAEEEHKTVLKNIQKNYYMDEIGNYEMADIENFLTGFVTPVGKKPIYASKTFFGSDKIFHADERSKDNSQHQAWNQFRANGVIGSQPSYFDVSDDLFQQYIHSENDYVTSYSKTVDEKASDLPFEFGDLSEDIFPFTENISSTNPLHEDSHLVNDDVENLVDDVSRPLDDGAEGLVDDVSSFEKDDLDSKNFHIDEVKTENRFSHSTMEGAGGEFEELDDGSTDDQENVFWSLNGDGQMSDPEILEDEFISEEHGVDSELFRWDKADAAEVFQDMLHFNMSNTKYPFENPGNEGHILHLDEQNVNESRFDKINHLAEVQNDVDSDLMGFVEKRNSDEASVTLKDPDLSKLDINEFQGDGDTEDNVAVALTDRLESKSGRIINSPRGNNTAECTTPKGERGRCRSLTQCPLSEQLNNFNLFLQYVCLSRGVLIGICCPDNPVVEISDPTENSTGTSVLEFKQPIHGCGLNSNTRIVGGKVSLPHEWTWMVALLRRNRFFCGGVIINDWYILTAAHCVMGIKVRDLKVRLGEYNFNEKNEHQEDIPVAEIKRHALFVTLTFQHDIALLKLKRRIEYTKFIGSICLPNPKSGNFTNVNATVVGWGTVAFGGTASQVLRQVTVPVWDNDECDKTYRLEKITNAFMCAGSPENGEDACQGDSGGPLMTLSEEGRWEVIGIVSWGRRCGDPTFPGVYTRVTSYLDWITENTN